MKSYCPILVALTFLAAELAGAATFTVTSTDDDGPGTLRAALASASDGDTIDVTGVSGTILLTSGELPVNQSVAIVGPGPTNLALDGNAFSRVFDISGLNPVVSIAGFTITNGAALGGFVGDSGGGLYNEGGTLTLSNCVITGNSAFFGGGVFNDGAFGTATLTAVNCTFSGNSASYFGGGGGIYNYSLMGTVNLAVSNSSILGNSAGYRGGGIYNFSEVGKTFVSVINSTLSGNSAGSYGGGGIENDGSGGSTTIQILSSTLSGNSAGGNGGGIDNFAESGSGILQVVNSTLSGNSAGGIGGGINNDGYNGNAVLMIYNSTLSSNSAGISGGGIWNEGQGGSAPLEIGSTILSAGDSGGTLTNDSGTVISLGYNLSSDAANGLLTNSTDLLNSDPMLGPLQDNGGPTYTHALLTGSPALDQGRNFSGSPYDQRGSGFVRTSDDPSVANAPGGDGTDIGAFEAPRSLNQPPVARCKNVIVPADTHCTADASIDDGSFDPDSDAITLTQSPSGPYPLGTNVVALTVTDSHGASNSCVALVIVQDTTPPQITCPRDVTTDATSAAGAIVSFAPAASDDCSGPPVVVCAPPSGSKFPIGANVVICTATDLAGNSASCRFRVTVLGPQAMLARLLGLVNSGVPHPQPLRATLNAAQASMNRHNLTSAINQLRAFENKVRAQVGRSDPKLAETLVQAAQNIIDTLNTTLP